MHLLHCEMHKVFHQQLVFNGPLGHFFLIQNNHVNSNPALKNCEVTHAVLLDISGEFHRHQMSKCEQIISHRYVSSSKLPIIVRLQLFTNIDAF